MHRFRRKRKNSNEPPDVEYAGMLPAWPALLSLSIFILASLAPSSLSATVIFDFEGSVFIDHGKTIKDHSLILKDGTFHLYYIMDNQKSFGYATSPDLGHWTIHDPVLETGPESWDSLFIWAPCVITYPKFPWYLLMYYTGVNNQAAQRTCLALTRTPSAWHKASTALFVPFHGDTSWIHWDKNEWSNYRDPCFFEENGICYIAHTASTKDPYGTIALAESDDHFNWNDAGPLYIHNNWHVLESPFLLKRNGKYHLFFTEEEVGGVSHMSSDSLTSGWDIIKRIIVDEGHAAELLDIGTDRHIFSRHTSYSSLSAITVSTIRFDTLTWNGDVPEVQISELLGYEWTVLWGNAFDHQPVFGNNPLYRGDDTTEVGFEGNWWIGTYESFNGPLTGTQPGSSQGDEPRGAIRSGTFGVTGRSMRLLVGGGCFPSSCYVALCDARNDHIIYLETGCDTDLMDERIWDLDPLSGREVYLLIVDDCSLEFGHINVDGIQESLMPVNPPPPYEPDPLPDEKSKRIKVETEASTEEIIVPATINSVNNYPNPFNPETEILFSSEPERLLIVVVYSVSGAEISRFNVKTDAGGRGRTRWNGRDRFGKPASAGLYVAALQDGRDILAFCKLVLVR